MAHAVRIQLEIPEDFAEFRLPEGVQNRLQELLDRQDSGQNLTLAERHEAEGLVDLAEAVHVVHQGVAVADGEGLAA